MTPEQIAEMRAQVAAYDAQVAAEAKAARDAKYKPLYDFINSASYADMATQLEGFAMSAAQLGPDEMQLYQVLRTMLQCMQNVSATLSTRYTPQLDATPVMLPSPTVTTTATATPTPTPTPTPTSSSGSSTSTNK